MSSASGLPRRATPAVETVRRVGSLVAIVLIGGGVATQAASVVQYTDNTPRPLPANLKRLVVDTEHGDIAVTPARGGGAQALPEARWSWQEPAIQITRSESGEEARVSSSCPGWTPFQSCRVAWRLEVPADTEVVLTSTSGNVGVRSMRGRVSATSKSGDVTLDQVDGPAVDVVTTTGDITLERVRTAQVNARTNTGDVRIRRGETPAVSAQSTTGNLTLDSGVAFNRLDATTTTGDVQVTVPRDPRGYRVDRRSNTGRQRVEIRTDPESDRVLRLESTTGDLTVTYPGG